MWSEIVNGIIKQTVQDTDPIITSDGKRYPAAWPKADIPNFLKVVPATQPDPTQFTITGSTVALVNGVPTQTITSTPIPLLTAQTAAYARINAGAQADLAKIIASYPDLEVATWDKQLADATAYTANNTASTPLLSAISAAMGGSQTVAQLAANVLEKSAQYQAASGAVIGKRLALCAQVPSATTVAEANAIVW